MASKETAGGESGARSGRALLAEALAHPPRHTTWVVTREKRLEARDPTGSVFAWANLEGGSVKDPDGRLLVTLAPAVKQIFSLSNIIASAIPGMLGSGSPPWRAVGGPTEAPPLNLKFVPVTLPFAQIQPDKDARSRIELLPNGRLNEKLIRRNLEPEVSAKIAERSPLVYRRLEPNLTELSDRQGRVLARTRDANVATGEQPEPIWSVDVADNNLPSAWLFAILIGCQRWHA